DAIERAQEFAAHLLSGGPVLHLDDRLVVDIQETVVGEPACLGDFLTDRHEARPRDVAEEVRLAPRAGCKEGRRLLAQADEDGLDGLRKGRLFALEALTSRVLAAGLLEIDELLEELLEPEPALEVLKQALQDRLELRHPREAAVDEREAGIDECLVPRHLAGRIVVRARIGDAAAEHLEILVHHYGLGGGRAEVDADETAHGVLAWAIRQPRPAASCPGAFARSSGNSSPAGS